MENYHMKRLTFEDENELNFIAKIHEELPSAWMDNYYVSEETIKNTSEELVSKHKNQDIYCSIIENNNKVISYIWAEINKVESKQIDIMSLWTDEKYRGLGLAKSLKIALERWAIDEMNAEKIHTTVNSKNTGIIQLNRNMGYEIQYYRMIKTLK